MENDNVEVTKAPYSDACGFTSLKLSNSTSPFPTTITFNGTSDSLSSIPVVTEKNPYKCVNGVAQWKGTVQTSIFQTSVTNANGSITVKNIYYPIGRTGGGSKQGLIAYTANLTKKIKPNACGFIVTPGYANSHQKTSSQFIYRINDLSQKKLTVEYPTVVTKNLAVNSCGFTEIKSLNAASGFNDTDKVKINGAEYTVSSLPLATTVPSCKNGVAYQVAP